MLQERVLGQLRQLYLMGQQLGAQFELGWFHFLLAQPNTIAMLLLLLLNVIIMLKQNYGKGEKTNIFAKSVRKDIIYI